MDARPRQPNHWKLVRANSMTGQTLHLKEGEEAEFDAAEGKWKAVPAVPNHDSRHMQSLPWSIVDEGEGKAPTMRSAGKKAIASFWGGDTRHPQNFEWCTAAQAQRHAHYAAHACNAFPVIQREIERIYFMEEMPEDAIKAIEALMEKFYYEEVPKYVGER